MGSGISVAPISQEPSLETLCTSMHSDDLWSGHNTTRSGHQRTLPRYFVMGFQDGFCALQHRLESTPKVVCRMSHSVVRTNATTIDDNIIHAFGITRWDANDPGASLALDTVARPTAFVTPLRWSTVATVGRSVIGSWRRC